MWFFIVTFYRTPYQQHNTIIFRKLKRVKQPKLHWYNFERWEGSKQKKHTTQPITQNIKRKQKIMKLTTPTLNPTTLTQKKKKKKKRKAIKNTWPQKGSNVNYVLGGRSFTTLATSPTTPRGASIFKAFHDLDCFPKCSVVKNLKERVFSEPNFIKSRGEVRVILTPQSGGVL